MTNDAGITIHPELMIALRQILHRLEGKDLNWAVVGSLGLSIRGAPIAPRDIDIMTDRAGAYEIGRIFSDVVSSPIALRRSEMIISHFGELRIDGIKVEVMGDFQIRLEDGTWQNPPDLKSLREFERIDDLIVPVLSLRWEADSYSKLGRMDREKVARDLMVNRTSFDK